MWLLALLTLAGGALRFATLDLQSFWFDETATVALVHMDLGGMLGEIPDSESTPPLYYVLAWLWAKAFGTGEVGLRSLSALAGTLMIPAAYLAGAELVGRRAGLVVAALAAFNPLLFWYSQEARAYALAALLTTLAVLLFARALRRPTGRTLALWALVSALALATHYFAVFVVAPTAGWLVVSGWRSEHRGRHLAAVLAPVAAALALLPLLLRQRSLDLAAFLRDEPLLERLVKAAKQGLVGFDAPLEQLAAASAGAIAGVAAVAALASAWRGAGERGRHAGDHEPTGVALAGALALLAVAVPFALALAGADYFGTRNLIVAWLPAAAVLAAGLARGRVGLAGTGALCAIGLTAIVGVAVVERWQRDDWRSAAEALPPARTARAVVLSPAAGSKQPITLYSPGLSPLPPQPVVREVAFVSVVDRAAGGVHPPPPPRGRTPLIRRFVVVRRHEDDAYTVVLLRAPRPRSLSRVVLNAGRLLPERDAALMLQRPLSAAGVARARRRPGG